MKMTYYQYFVDRIPLFYVFMSGIGFSMQALVIKLLAEQGIHGSLYCVTMRGIIQCIMSLCFIFSSKEWKDGTPLFGNSNYIKMILFLRSFTGFGSIASGYLAIEYIPVGDSTVLVMLSPMMAAILSYFMLGEPWRIPELIGTIVSLVGAIFVARPPFLFGTQEGDMSSTDSKAFYTGVFIALFASFNASFAFVFVRILGTSAKMPWYYVTLSQSLAQIFLSPPLMAILKVPFIQPVTLYSAGLIFTGAFIGAWSQAAMTIGMQREKSASATAMRMSDVVFGFLWQALFTVDKINTLAIIGAVLVSCSILIVVVFKPQSDSSSQIPQTVTATNDESNAQIEMVEMDEEIISQKIQNNPDQKKSLKEIIASSLNRISYEARRTFGPLSPPPPHSVKETTEYSPLTQIDSAPNDDVEEA